MRVLALTQPLVSGRVVGRLFLEQATQQNEEDKQKEDHLRDGSGVSVARQRLMEEISLFDGEIDPPLVARDPTSVVTQNDVNQDRAFPWIDATVLWAKVAIFDPNLAVALLDAGVRPGLQARKKWLAAVRHGSKAAQKRLGGWDGDPKSLFKMNSKKKGRPGAGEAVSGPVPELEKPSLDLNRYFHIKKVYYSKSTAETLLCHKQQQDQ